MPPGENRRCGAALPAPVRPFRDKEALANGGAQQALGDRRFRIGVHLVLQDPLQRLWILHHMPAFDRDAGQHRLAIGEGGHDFENVAPRLADNFRDRQRPRRRRHLDRLNPGRGRGRAIHAGKIGPAARLGKRVWRFGRTGFAVLSRHPREGGDLRVFRYVTVSCSLKDSRLRGNDGWSAITVPYQRMARIIPSFPQSQTITIP